MQSGNSIDLRMLADLDLSGISKEKVDLICLLFFLTQLILLISQRVWSLFCFVLFDSLHPVNNLSVK